MICFSIIRSKCLVGFFFLDIFHCMVKIFLQAYHPNEISKPVGFIMGSEPSKIRTHSRGNKIILVLKVGNPFAPETTLDFENRFL